MQDPVVHFEMPAKDKKRVSKFYSKVFGWKMQQLGEEMGDYVLAHTAKTDEKGMIQQNGAINGGFFQYQDEEGFNMPHLVIAVEDLEEGMKRVEDAGGEILGGASGPGKIDDIPGIGRYISFKDSEGNNVGMLEPAPRQS
jgi:predicted enzyme related to lactoylglutathione lyase